MPDNNRVAPKIVQKLVGTAGGPVNFGVSVELANRYLGAVHLVHGPNVVEEVSCPKPGVRLGNVVGRTQDVPVARVTARSETRNAAKQSLYGRHLPERNVHVQRNFSYRFLL